MTKPILSSFEAIAPLIIQQYERYLPTAFDESMSLLEKVNKTVQYANEIGAVSNEVIEKWNEVMEWIMGEGLTEAVSAKIDQMLADGIFEDIINNVIFGELNTKVTALEKSAFPNRVNLTGYDLTTLDASPIIRSLIDLGYTHILLPKSFTLKTTLNLTDLQDTPVTLEGVGKTQGTTGNASIGILSTGGLGVDQTGSQNIVWKNVGLTSQTASNPSTIGILQARSTTNLYAQFNRFENFWLRLTSMPALNNGLGTIGIYNFKSELSEYHNIYVQSDTPMVLTVTNRNNIASPYKTFAGEVSMKSVTFTGNTVLVASYGHALILDGANDISFSNLYMQRDKFSASTQQYAILAQSDSSVDFQLNNLSILSFDNELFPSLMKVEAKITNALIKGMQTHGELEIFRLKTNSSSVQSQIAFSNIMVNKGASITGTYQDLIYVESGSYGVNGSTVYMPFSKYRIYSEVIMHGNIFMSSADPNLSLVAGSRYLNVSDRGVGMNGRTLDWGGKPTSGNWKANDIRFNFDGNAGAPLGHVCVVSAVDGNGGTWEPFGRVGTRQVADQTTLTPNFIGEEIIVTVGGVKSWWKSVGLTSSDWTKISN